LLAVCGAATSIACSSSDGNASIDDDAGNDASGGTSAPSDAATDSGAVGDTRTDASDVHGTDTSPTPDASETLATSFVFVGCNRLQKADWDPTTNPSSANQAQLLQTLDDVNALADRPKTFVFTGDLVLGLKATTTDLTSQLAGWASVWKGHAVSSSVSLVPMPGNHEMLYKDKTSGLEFSNSGSDDVWTSWIAAQGFDGHAGNGPTGAPPNADALQDDQSKLSYSFDDAGVHYVVLNTDTWTTTADATTGATQIGWIALHWLEADIAAAQANASVSSIFVFGHKPIVSPTGGTDGDSAISPDLVPELESTLDGASKVKGYFCAHAHEWDARTLPGSRGVYQIVAGNGGSQLETGWTVATPYYGFTEARIYSSGRVGIVSHQRPVPTPYDATPAVPAVATPELTISVT
jgi:hypothetical protein